MDKHTYRTLSEPVHIPRKVIYLRIGTFITFCIACYFIAYATWSTFYQEETKTIEHSTNFHPMAQANSSTFQRKLVCYFGAPSDFKKDMTPDHIDPFLCTHINVGIATIEDNQIVIADTLNQTFTKMKNLKKQNDKLKILIWVGGPSNSIGIIEMINKHANRLKFVKSIKHALHSYKLDGIDFDWEFPSSDSKIHFSQLLYELRRAFKSDYLLSLAVAAPEGIAYFAYNFNILNQYCDYINVMTYDFHFYSKSSPFTGLNAPLYKRTTEQSVFATLNINASVNFWKEAGLDKSKIVVGLPTYGHSFHLVNPFNTKIGSPADGFGHTGSMGFVTYSDVCTFDRSNIFADKEFDSITCSPYISAEFEWISYEDERSVKCKTKYVIDNDLGGIMIFSLNTDDYLSTCFYGKPDQYTVFPLTNVIRDLLFKNQTV